MSNSSIWRKYSTLDQSEPASHGFEGGPHILENSSIIWTSDCLMSYPLVEGVLAIWDFLLQNFVSRSFLVHLRYFLVIFLMLSTLVW